MLISGYVVHNMIFNHEDLCLYGSSKDRLLTIVDVTESDGEDYDETDDY